MRVAQRPSVSDVPKGTLYHHLIFKGLGRGSGELCHRLAPTHTHAREGGWRGWVGKGLGRGRGGDLDLQAGTRDLSAGTLAWTLLQLARGEQAGFLHTRHDISELIPSSPAPPLPSVFPSTLPLHHLLLQNPLRRLAAHLLPGPGSTEGMGSELNLDTEFPHFTDGRERLCIEVRKLRGARGGAERERGGLIAGAEAGPISHRGCAPLKRAAANPLSEGEGLEPFRRPTAISFHKAINGALYNWASETLLIC